MDADTHRQLFGQVALDPELQVTVDLEEQLVHLPGDEDVPFDIDPFARRMLLDGTDEIGWLLARSSAINAWEAAHPARIDTRPTSAVA